MERLEEERRDTLKHLQEIDDRAIKLHDGRRAYVDGSEYRDKNGIFLRGADRDEADRLRARNASTWTEESSYEKLRTDEVRLMHDLRKDRQELDELAHDGSGLSDTDRGKNLKEVQALVEKREKEAKDLTNSYSEDYTAYEASSDRASRPAISGQFAAATKGQAEPALAADRPPVTVPRSLLAKTSN